MKIERVEYRQLKSTGNFENETYGATAIVEKGEVAGVVMERLKDFVQEFFVSSVNNKERREDLRADIMHAEHELALLTRDIEQSKKTWEKAKAFLASHGLEVDTLADLPF